MPLGAEMSETHLSRLDFLKVARAVVLTACGLLGLDGLIRFLDTQTDPSAQTDFDVGPATGYPVGSRTIRLEIPAVLFRSETGFTALSLVCTHLGCTVEYKVEGFTCPCHGSRFNTQGKVVRGPAKNSLRPLRTEIKPDDHIHVYTG
jgi:cytochrome b6-f complex iron-sulfur subunit